MPLELEFARSPEKPPTEQDADMVSGVGDDLASVSDAMTVYSELKLTNRERGYEDAFEDIKRYLTAHFHQFSLSLDY